jgi:hypothetical protein
VAKQNRGAQGGIVVMLEICFGQLFEGYRINSVLDVRPIDAEKDDPPAALNRELRIWTGWNILKFCHLRGGSPTLTS